MKEFIIISDLSLNVAAIVVVFEDARHVLRVLDSKRALSVGIMR